MIEGADEHTSASGWRGLRRVRRGDRVWEIIEEERGKEGQVGIGRREIEGKG